MRTTTKLTEPAMGKETPVRVSLLIVIIGFVTGATWWAASIDTNIQSMARILASIQVSIEAFQKDQRRQEAQMQALENRVELMDKTGTTALRTLETRITKLEIK